jgi:transcriptional regulator with XRE-family HTH domain
MSQIGQRAREIRQRRGESQEAVSRRAGLALTTYSRIENGHNEPSMGTLQAIARALEVAPGELIDPVLEVS